MQQKDIPDSIEIGVALGPLTSMGIGGPAQYFGRAGSVKKFEEWVRWAVDHRLEIFLLGSGTNVLVADRGFDGFVIQPELRGITRKDRGDHVLVTAGAGEQMDDLCRFAVERHLQGLECLSGIPGTVGAGPVQNIGAYGQELSDTVEWVTAFDMHRMKWVNLTCDACNFGYRNSRFKSQSGSRYGIVSVTLKLKKDALAMVQHQQLAKNLGRSESVALSEIRQAVLDLRASKSMLLRPHDPDSRGCGSFFMNPILSPDEYARFCARGVGEHPHYSDDAGSIKIPAAWLIEQAGFSRGARRGRISLSRKHVQAITNRGGAMAREVLEFVAEIQQTVFGRFGIALVPEPIFLGCQKPRVADETTS